MKRFESNQTILSVLALLLAAVSQSCWLIDRDPIPKRFTHVKTIAGTDSNLGEPFGIVESNGEVFVSDGESGRILSISADGKANVIADGLDTPSHIALDREGNLVVADSGDHTIKRVSKDGNIELIAGVKGEGGYRDGEADLARFRAPIGVAVSEGKIFVADSYNDRIRLIENGHVTTIAGSVQGFSDNVEGHRVKFDTPCGLAVWDDGRLIVADTGNARLRVVEKDGRVWTLAGDGRQNLRDGLLSQSSLQRPTDVTVSSNGLIYIADGNVIRVIGRRLIPMIETISNSRLGFSDGQLLSSRFNRPSGLSLDPAGNLFVADSANQLIRVFTTGTLGKNISNKEFETARMTERQFKTAAPPRWTYDPPSRPREIAGTLGEIRGDLKDEESEAYFHNGLDIVGGYGETARFIRGEKVLRPIAVQNFDTTRELIRMPTLGYIHIRLGRDVNSKPFEDSRFLFSFFNGEQKPTSLRIPRGSKFEAGEAIGTLNTFNHVHLIAGRSGQEMNALAALDFPGVSDSRTPVIEEISFYDEGWNRIETESQTKRIEIVGKARIVVRAFDQMDGNAARRKLGLYRLGFQILDSFDKPVKGFENPLWTIRFQKLPDAKAVRLVYAVGSKSGATGETVFRYTITNRVNGKVSREGFLDSGSIGKGDFSVRVFAADFFGNTTSKDIKIRIN